MSEKSIRHAVSTLNMFELKKAVTNARQTTPGKGSVCYKMLANMTDKYIENSVKTF